MAKLKRRKADKSSKSIDGQNWLVESLRFSAFFCDSSKTKSPSFENLFGLKPDRIAERVGDGVRQEVGVFEGHRWLLSKSSLRADLVVSSSQPSDSVRVLEIGSLESANKVFIPTIKKWAAKSAPIKRIAIAPTLISEASSLVEANTKLKHFLPTIQFDPNNESDFFWQINRPRKSKVISGLRINRLSKWQVLTIKRVLIGSDGEKKEPVPAIPIIQVELDINTDPSRQNALPKVSLSRLFEELTGLAVEISISGDVK